MDPNETLRLLREAITGYDEAALSSADAANAAAERIIELFEALELGRAEELLLARVRAHVGAGHDVSPIDAAALLRMIDGLRAVTSSAARPVSASSPAEPRSRPPAGSG
jgi:hypothetical protein